MRGSIFCIFLFTLLWSTGASAKVHAVRDNTRNNAIHTTQQALQPLQKTTDKITSALDEDFRDKFLWTNDNDEEDDLSVSVPLRKQVQSVVAYFIAAYLSQIAYQTNQEQSFIQEKPIVALNRSQICIFRI